MKRIVFCFDGTWNKLAVDTPTNVVLTAASIEREARDGTVQIIHYDEGVGTGALDKVTGGVFGAGLVSNVREAYRFLIFNYDPGDEIYVFGFSRGAFSARTFIGFVRHVGPLSRLHVARIDEALGLYEQRLGDADGAGERMRRFRADYSAEVCIGADDDSWRCENVPGYIAGQAPPLRIRYLGAWDTVEALGVPGMLWISRWTNRGNAFHDPSITDFVESVRHAVAIDERRSTFPATLCGDLDVLNAAKGKTSDAPDAPYQEKWFPGVHGSVGGGGDIRGLSDGALDWVLKGAKLAGLKLDIKEGSRIQAFAPDPFAPLVNRSRFKSGFLDRLSRDRPGPGQIWQVSTAAIRRWKADASTLPEKKRYRPKSLARVAAELDELTLPGPVAESTMTTHRVALSDTLGRIAQLHYGKASLWPDIFDANRDQIDDPDEIFIGQTLRIPHPPPER
ncbi:MAG TPA: DUF2235 domain-containing protein [Allosphingosinicella sp.]|nr:DUF2235 domain-containing protein [Allosphingosinicella sp.]